MTNISIFVVLILMVFFHIVDDFYLQKGLLSNLKQRSWWKENAPEELYKNDYIIALMLHALSWSIMITLPIMLASNWNPHWSIYLLFGINFTIHSIVDDLKANKHKINLITDQCIHLAQILFTWCIWAFTI